MAPAECTQTNAVVGPVVPVETETVVGDRGAVTYSIVRERAHSARSLSRDSAITWVVSTGTDRASLFPDVTVRAVTRAQDGEAKVSKKRSEQRRFIVKLPEVGRLSREIGIRVTEEEDGIYADCGELQATESGSDIEDAILNLVESLAEQFAFWNSVEDTELIASAKVLRDRYVSLKR